MARYYTFYTIILILVVRLSIAFAQPVEPNVDAISGKHPSGEITDRRQKTARAVVTASATTSTDIPSPYDTLAYNFANTTSCRNFYAEWRANKTITDCHPVSLLLENSNAFFHALRSNTTTSRILNTTCAQDVDQCTSIMSNLAVDLLKSKNCGLDYQNGNSVVQGTYRDLVAYKPIYSATCLKNTATQNYCFVDAISNSTSPDDYSVYLMPLGTALSTGSKPSCSTCLRNTVDLFSQWAKVDGQPLTMTYLSSASVMNAYCGTDFAPTNITVGSSTVTAGASAAVPSGVGVVLSVLLALCLV